MYRKSFRKFHGNNFSIPLSLISLFTVTSCAATNFYPLRILFSRGKKNARCCRVLRKWRMLHSYHIVLGKLLFAVLKNKAISCSFFGMFPPTAFLWRRKILNCIYFFAVRPFRKRNHSGRDHKHRPQRGSSLTFARPSRKRLCH
jgi:hypothetical protein